ncbi:MAG: hypothetical protein AMDU1_APLC00027G0007 [Thermoplasmatales archaeon A-plasma]|jgi:metal-responsive CopG/Arc/MetJ family transcriptional regulator|nr:MAG: hypothetical protein AMDU1_APLC00027G0007 [Thermoplasmatales archaeon A-plasma]
MKYRTVALPKELIDEVERARNIARLGYRSNAEFIADAVRSKIREESARTYGTLPSVEGATH